MAARQQHGLRWDDKVSPLEVEFRFIRGGGYLEFQGRRYGRGAFYHHRAAQYLCWPEDDVHRWSDLQLKTICEERVTVVQGPRDCGKTRGNSKWALIDYWTSPEDTLTIMTSTGIRELELRVWGDIKDLFQRARQRFPFLAGHLNQISHGVFTDELDTRGDIRDMRKGLICVPCIGGDGEWIGLDRFVGIKQKRRRLIGDELQFIHAVYVNVLDAFDKGDFKGVFSGNPIGGNGKALDKIAEPIAGWSSLGEITKTTTWRNKYGGVTINFVGTDSPNFDVGRPKDYPYLIDQEDVDRVALRNGRDSAQFWTFILGVRKIGADAYRVLTVEMCERCGAFNSTIWAGGDRIKVYAIDAGFGGDPCEAMYCEFGEDVNGRQVIEFSETKTIPISVSSEFTAEDQIALYVQSDCGRLGVPITNIFFDAGMRATLPLSFGRIMGEGVNAVNFGGPATSRPVSQDAFTTDPKTQERRLVKCSERYSKFVTEMWYSVREVVEAKQARCLPRAVAEEFAMREWRWVPGPLGERYELETKLECKKRMGNSPNKADATSIAVEGCRRLGFEIKNLKELSGRPEEEQGWLELAAQKARQARKRTEVSYG